MYNRREDYDSYSGEKGSDDVYSKPIRAGKRTYFFDVKSTRGEKDFYLTITESKRRNNPDGSFTFDKHKIFLYKEDFEKFREGFDEVVEYIKNQCFGGEFPERPAEEEVTAEQQPQTEESDVF